MPDYLDDVFAALGSIAFEQVLTCPVIDDRSKTPGQGETVAHASAQPLGQKRRHEMRGVAREHDPPMFPLINP